MNFLIIVAAFLLCHGLTTFLVVPIQKGFLPDATVFASLIFLPHGVRVLATWAFGWRAIFPLTLAAGLSVALFRTTEEVNFLEPALLESILIGAVAAFLAFELARLAGFDFYSGGTKRLRWRGMILIGALSSVINSIGQTYVFSGLIGFDRLLITMAIYAIGDVVGLIICMIALMFIFRWWRGSEASATRRNDG